MAFEDMPTNPLTPQEEAELHRLLNDLPVGEPPADLTARIMAAVAAEENKAKVIELPKRKPAFRWKSLVSLAAVFALALIGSWSFQQGQVAAPAEGTQGETEIASYSMEERRRAVVSEVSDDSDTADDHANAEGTQQAVITGALPAASTELTPNGALELLIREWFEKGTSYTLTATQLSTDPLSCQLRFADGDRVISEGTLTYLETTDSGFRFTWSEGDNLPWLFTVAPDGAITQDTLEVPAE